MNSAFSLDQLSFGPAVSTPSIGQMDPSHATTIHAISDEIGPSDSNIGLGSSDDGLSSTAFDDHNGGGGTERSPHSPASFFPLYRDRSASSLHITSSNQATVSHPQNSVAWWSYASVKQRFEERVFYIEDTQEYGDWSGEDHFQILNKADLRYLYGGMVYYKNNSANPVLGVSRLFLPLWLKDEYKRRYFTVDYLPLPLACPENVGNLFRSVKFQPDTFHTCSDNWRHVLNRTFQNDALAAQYFMDWMAHLVQYPSCRMDTAVVFITHEPLRSIPIIKLVTQALGSRHSSIIESVTECLSGSASSGLASTGKLLLCLDCDYVSGGVQSALVQMKNRWAKSKHMIKDSHRKPRWFSHYERYIGVTRCKTPITNDRAMKAWFVDIPCLPNNDDTVSIISKDTINGFLAHLAHRDVSGFGIPNHRNPPPPKTACQTRIDLVKYRYVLPSPQSGDCKQ